MRWFLIREWIVSWNDSSSHQIEMMMISRIEWISRVNRKCRAIQRWFDKEIHLRINVLTSLVCYEIWSQEKFIKNISIFSFLSDLHSNWSICYFCSFSFSSSLSVSRSLLSIDMFWFFFFKTYFFFIISISLVLFILTESVSFISTESFNAFILVSDWLIESLQSSTFTLRISLIYNSLSFNSFIAKERLNNDE